MSISRAVGPSVWAFLDEIGRHYAITPTADEKRAADQLARSFAYIFPCGVCCLHYRALLVNNPPRVESRTAFLEWILAIHNAVNRLTGRSEWSLVQYHAAYDERCASAAATNVPAADAVVWDVLYWLALLYPLEPCALQKQAAQELLFSLVYLFPSAVHRPHYQHLLYFTCPPQVDSKQDFLQWVLTCHNTVRQRTLQPPQWTLQQMLAHYQDKVVRILQSQPLLRQQQPAVEEEREKATRTAASSKHSTDLVVTSHRSAFPPETTAAMVAAPPQKPRPALSEQLHTYHRERTQRRTACLVFKICICLLLLWSLWSLSSSQRFGRPPLVPSHDPPRTSGAYSWCPPPPPLTTTPPSPLPILLRPRPQQPLPYHAGLRHPATY